VTATEHASEGFRISRPAEDKEVTKLNVYERTISLNTQLAPLFPYFGPGSVVVCATLQRGRPQQDHGQFFHEIPRRSGSSSSSNGRVRPTRTLRTTMFATLWGALTTTEKFNDDEALRTCSKCGYVNPPFPFTAWGWHDWVKQNRVVDSARAAMLAARDRLSPAEVAS
jgi:hypothetical protein